MCTIQKRCTAHKTLLSHHHELRTQPEILMVEGHRVYFLGFVNTHTYRHGGVTSGLNFPQGEKKGTTICEISYVSQRLGYILYSI